MTLPAPVLTPHGALVLAQAEDPLSLALGQEARLRQAFERGSGHGLLSLGADEVGSVLPPVLTYWRELGAGYVTALCASPGIEAGGRGPPLAPPAEGELERMAASAPPMLGAEYL